MELEKLYREAQSALKAKDYDRANNLLKQILVIDDDYKDASRLLARIVKEKRRRWYNDVRIGRMLGVLSLIGLGFFIAPKLSSYYAVQLPTQIVNATTTLSPSAPTAPTETLPPTPTPIPLTWKRIYGGDEFRRATITAITIDPRDPDVIYVGTESAGIYKSIDGGRSWKPAHHGLLLANIDTLVIDPNNPRILYAGIISAGVYKTTDGGENWQIKKEAVNPYSSKIIMDQTDSSHLYFYTQGGAIRQSNDGGESWTETNSSNFSFDIVSLVLHPTDPQTLLAGGNDGGIYISFDEGATWTLLYETKKPTNWPTVPELKVDTSSGDFILVNSPESPDASNVYNSSDEGKTWVLRPRINCKTLTIHPDKKTIFCGATDGTVYKSTDVAQTWSLLAVLPIGQVRVITVSPHDPNVLRAGGAGLFISFDGGQNWEEQSNGLGREIIELGIDPMDNTKFYGVAGEKAPGNSEFIYRSLDQGLNWKFRKKNCKLVFGTDGNLVCYHLENTKPAESYIETDSLGGCGRRGFAAVNPYRQNEFYLAGRENCKGIKLSVNSGISWNDTNVSQELSEAKFFFATDQKTIYATSINGSSPPRIYRSVDGANWETCGEISSISSAASRFAIDPNNSAVVYLATRGDGVYTSQDGCKSWQTSKAGLDNMFINAVATDTRGLNIVYAGTDSGAYISTDGGETWNQINDGLLGATVVYSIAADKDSNVYATTPYGIFKLESK
jgi:photosystem II stability/assembly factor-like uncharacterized protein